MVHKLHRVIPGEVLVKNETLLNRGSTMRRSAVIAIFSALAVLALAVH